MRSGVRHCRLCEEPMNSSPFTMCSKCLIDSDRINTIINKRPFISIEEISQLSDVPKERIRKLAQLDLKRNTTSEVKI